MNADKHELSPNGGAGRFNEGFKFLGCDVQCTKKGERILDRKIRDRKIGRGNPPVIFLSQIVLSNSPSFFISSVVSHKSILILDVMKFFKPHHASPFSGPCFLG